VSALLALLAALLGWLGFAGVGWWPLALVGFVPLFAALERAGRSGGARVFLVAWLFGTALWGACCHWLLHTLRTFSGLPLAVCFVLAVLVFVAHGGLYASFGWLVWRAQRRGASTALAAGAAIAACEWLYPTLFPGYYGASLHPLPLVLQSAELGGPLALSALCLAVNGALYELRMRPRAAALTAAVLVAVLAYGVLRTRGVEAQLAGAPRLRVGIVQPHMGALAKWTDLRENARRLFEGTRALELSARPDLIVWPEAAWAVGVPAGLEELSETMQSEVHTPLLFGSVVRTADEATLNRVLLADAQGEILGTYDKVERMPFGEYLPLADWLPRSLRALWPGRASVEPGRDVAPLELGALRISALVCLEDLVPGFVRRVMREGSPHLLVNLTNDAWFGESDEVWIHLALAKLRAVEQRRTLVRATNSGVSAVIDPLGRVVAQAPAFSRETLVAEAVLLDGATPYQALGDWPGWLGAAAILWLSFARRGAGRKETGAAA
jgi:apolipoprotein N-acyltransferase